MGQADRVIRSLVAAILIVLYVEGITSGVMGIILIAIAIIFLLTSLVSVCPLYKPFGWNTRKKKEA